MISFPNCKINIGLRVGNKRPDGYHEIESVFYPVALHDALELIELPGSSSCHFSTSGLPIDGEISNNLCVKAFHLLKNAYPQLPGIRLHLHKQIPLGAGLGGGSSDAAFTLLLLNNKFQLGISNEDLKKIAANLGSDCPFFIDNVPSIVTGRGEVIEPIALDLSRYSILTVNPGIYINTGWAFGRITANTISLDLATIIKQPVSSWKNSIRNDFEKPICAEYPELGRIRELLYASNALYVSMSGSGSSFFGIFENERPAINFPPHYYWKWV